MKRENRMGILLLAATFVVLAGANVAAVNATYSFSGGDCTQESGVDATKLAANRDGRGNNSTTATVPVICPVTGHESATIDEVELIVYYDDTNATSGEGVVCYWGRQDDSGGLTTSSSLESCGTDPDGCTPAANTHTGRGKLKWGNIWSSATVYSYFADCDLPVKNGTLSWITGYEVEQTAR